MAAEDGLSPDAGKAEWATERSLAALPSRLRVGAAGVADGAEVLWAAQPAIAPYALAPFLSWLLLLLAVGLPAVLLLDQTSDNGALVLCVGAAAAAAFLAFTFLAVLLHARARVYLLTSRGACQTVVGSYFSFFAPLPRRTGFSTMLAAPLVSTSLSSRLYESLTGRQARHVTLAGTSRGGRTEFRFIYSAAALQALLVEHTGAGAPKTALPPLPQVGRALRPQAPGASHAQGVAGLSPLPQVLPPQVASSAVTVQVVSGSGQPQQPARMAAGPEPRVSEGGAQGVGLVGAPEVAGAIQQRRSSDGEEKPYVLYL